MKMKKSMTLVFALFFAGIIAGCTNTYTVHTTDGKTYFSEGKPVIDNDTGMLTFKDEHGKEQQLPKNEVTNLAEF